MEGTGEPTQPDSRGLAVLAAGLARRLAEANPDSNLVFSPLSIKAALALLAAGARGDTLDEILHVLGARSRVELEQFVSRVEEDTLKDRSGSGGPSVAFASGVWSDLTCPLKPAFRDAVVGSTYKAEASSVDFVSNPEAARNQINAWVARATRGLIGSVFGPGTITPQTRVVLGDAIYFKGAWEDAFDKKSTANEPFHRLDGGTVDVPFMQSWERLYIAVHDGFKVLKLRYKMQSNAPDRHSGHRRLSPPGNSTPTQLSMCIFLPDAPDGLRSLVEMMASQPGFVHEHLPKKKVEVGQFGLPKFKLSFQSNIVAVLKDLGLRLPFGDQADLSDMVEDDGSGLPVAVSEAIHKAVIEVNEEGTEAAALSIFDMMFGCSPNYRPPPRVDFVADHPFAYFIVEEATGAVVFAGHVLDPSKEN